MKNKKKNLQFENIHHGSVCFFGLQLCRQIAKHICGLRLSALLQGRVEVCLCLFASRNCSLFISAQHNRGG